MIETQAARRSKVPFVAAIVVAVVLLIGLTAGAFAWGRESEHHATAASAPPSAAWMQHACEQWMGTYTEAAPPSSWCASMWYWMQSDGPGMMGMMWWGNPDQFRSACVSRTGADAKAWCDAMTTWMQRRASQYGGWGPWMMRPSP
jgi:hypothetical protein